MEALGRVPANQPKEHQMPCNVGRFGGSVVFDEPRQHDAVALEIVTHAIEPFHLRGAHHAFHRTCGFTRAVARQPLHRVVALIGRKLEGRIRPHCFQHPV